MQNKFKMAFTLAEVIITLGIIGIVAEIVVPDVVNNAQKQVAATKLRQAYGILIQATNSISTDCSDILGCLSSTTLAAGNGNAAAAQEVANLYKGKLFLAKDCTDGTTKGCFASDNYKSLNTTVYGDFNLDSSIASVVLRNGETIGFQWVGLASATNIIDFYVDINGLQSPNMIGKDMFLFFYDRSQKRFVPCSDNTCSSSGTGWGCAGKIIQEGAINYY